jgi:hypothetical protein
VKRQSESGLPIFTSIVYPDCQAVDFRRDVLVLFDGSTHLA